MLTPLAEGADRLAAYAALDSGISFIAPLPMPVDEYRKDFTTLESLNEFNELLGKADTWFELPLPVISKTEELRQDEGNRIERYYNVGSYIAMHSQLLIALWDGIDEEKRGGTANIVSLKRKGLSSPDHPVRQQLNEFQSGTVCHILTPRISVPAPADAFSRKMIYSDYWGTDETQAMEIDRQLLSHIDGYNKDIKELSPGLKEKIEQNEKILFLEDAITKENPKLPGIAWYQAVTDTMASYYQSKRFFALKVLLILTMIAFLFFQLYVEFWHKPEILLLYPLTMGIGALWFLNANRKKFEQKHEDYRALAEAFRVQYYITISEREANVSEYYLQKHKGELEWVIYALRASLFKISTALSKTNSDKITLAKCKYITDNWVIDQMVYYKKTSRKYHFLLKNLRVIANILFFGALGAAILLFLLSLRIGHLTSFILPFKDLLYSILVVCTHSFLVISAALHGYIEKMIFAEQTKTCQQMYQLFSLAFKKLARAITSKDQIEAGEIIWELAQESLIESADWLLLHRSRPMEIPKG
jgi:hypothetical protein